MTLRRRLWELDLRRRLVDNHQRIVGRGTLKVLGFRSRRGEPGLDFLSCGQDHRHCLLVDRRDESVGLGGHETVDFEGGFTGPVPFHRMKAR
jgi:hypothetical protein